MAKCGVCNREMMAAPSCNPIPIIFGGERRDPIPYGKEKRALSGSSKKENCGDCNVQIGGYHHQYCDMAECPFCHGQLISCECTLKGA
jgi:hypothetical protein